MRRLRWRWSIEVWIMVAAVAVLAIAGFIGYLNLTSQIGGARDDLNTAAHAVDRAQTGITNHDIVLEGMGAELKGLSTNLEAIEVNCHKVARHTPGEENEPARIFSHYQWCMAHHGWKPVGWKG